MSASDRQNRILVAEDWKRIYQSFRNADFQSYDFDNLRRVMINYIRENYPEDFNDYIESSEYLALIDLIAFLGQSISYRVDLNARDNFIELAERRESVLRLARLLSYNSKRNIAGSGLLKFNSVSTTQTILDSNGRNIAGQTIVWNDPANANWYDQFIKIVNAALPSTRQFGNPDDKNIIQGIDTEQYRFQSVNTGVPVYGFTKSVSGRGMDFEIVSTVFRDRDEIYEEPPLPGNRMAFIYRNDNKGNASEGTGFFMHFRQGILNQGIFTIDQPSTNESVDIDAVNINNDDVWLYRLNQDQVETEYWAKVSSLEGNNIIYNSIEKNIKNIYSVVTRTNDRITLVFSDGVFGSLPRGTFKTFYRVSNGVSYTINPKDIRNVSIEIPYASNLGQFETLTISLTLHEVVNNSSQTETNDSIKANAPATYYTQNRMITAEDYNISPLSVNQEIIKVKAINRSSSGISRYFDLVDPTGKYSKTSLFADDGALYKEDYNSSFRFSYTTLSDIEGVIYNQLLPKLEDKALRDFYYDKFPRRAIDSSEWLLKTSDTNMATGCIVDNLLIPKPIGDADRANANLRFVKSGSLVKFIAPSGMYFDKSNNNKLVTLSQGQDVKLIPNASTTIWSKIVSVFGSGEGTVNNDSGTKIGELENGTGPVVLNDIVPSGAIVSQVIPVWRTTLDSATIAAMTNLIFANKVFGLRYDTETASWKIITESNLSIYGEFSTSKQGNTNNQQLDSSWLIIFTTDNEFYTVKFRLTRYIFESDKQIRFYFDSSDKIYDVRSNTIVKDKIDILSINTMPNSTYPFTYNRDWEITEEFSGIDGYVDTKKIQVTFNDVDSDGVVDNPEIYNDIVGENNFVFLEKYNVTRGQQDYRVYDNTNNKVIVKNSQAEVDAILSQFNLGQYFYFKDLKIIKQLVRSGNQLSLSITDDFKVYPGRDKLKFHYVHNADYETRIDPGITNFIDVFILTRQYDTLYRQWIRGTIDEEPLPMSTDSLRNMLDSKLNQIKSISDEVIYHPVKYKVLFGSKAADNVKALFKIVKSPETVISDNDIKSRVLSAINDFFSLENWDFGDNFYFTELSAFVMNRMAPNIVNFVIVPVQDTLAFGSLYEVRSEKDQIFISGATIDDIEIIPTITASNIRSSNVISPSSNILNTQNIISARNR
jgi:hypothetical protein